MGRGRQKAKHTKVARELKYFSPDTNYTQLERELAAGGGSRHSEDLEKWPEYTEYEDKYGDDEFDADEVDEKTA